MALGLQHKPTGLLQGLSTALWRGSLAAFIGYLSYSFSSRARRCMRLGVIVIP